MIAPGFAIASVNARGRSAAARDEAVAAGASLDRRSPYEDAMPTVLITGANRGIGLEFARQYAADWWRVIATARRPHEAEELRRLCEASEGRLKIEPLDVEDFAAIDRLAEKLRGQPIDVIINNAGLFGPKRSAESDARQSFGHMDFEIWHRLLSVNMMAAYKMAEAFVDHVAASDDRKIVAISSTLGSIGTGEGQAYAYATSKAGLNMVMHKLAVDLKPRGIATAAYCPGWVRTSMGGSAAALAPSESVRGLREQIARLSLGTSGGFFLHDGRPIPW
jgi:NAD(P)-dependent dehydrogenase (short-subunit alcohol dehydrogenase family)